MLENRQPNFWRSRTGVVLIGFILVAAWRVLYQAQRSRQLATAGAYARLRHPQYVAFILIMFGFLLQWPTILTVLMFPLLVWMYVRLALAEERDAQRDFGATWERYAVVTPRWFPHIGATVDTRSPQRLKRGAMMVYWVGVASSKMTA